MAHFRRKLLMAFVAVVIGSTAISLPAKMAEAERAAKVEKATNPAVVEAARALKLKTINNLRSKIDQRRNAAWSWQDLSLSSRTRSSYRDKWSNGVPDLNRLLRIWSKRQRTYQIRAMNPPHLELWLCIQSGIRGGKWDWLVHRSGGKRIGKGEASWSDDGSPYWGGLQMGEWFHETYGGDLYSRLGTANNWRPIQQIWVAERAFKLEGYSIRWVLGQWPRTSPPCISLLE